MTRIRLMAMAVSAPLVLMPAPSFAHHSFAMFDFNRVVTLTGTIKEIQWAAPHVLIWFVADAETGTAAADTAGRVWTVELATSPGPLTRIGWNKRTVGPGDRVTIELCPLRSGEPGGSFRKLTILSTGQVLTSAAVGSEPQISGLPQAK